MKALTATALCLAVAGCGGGAPTTVSASAGAWSAPISTAVPTDSDASRGFPARADEVRIDQLPAYASPADGQRTAAPREGIVLDAGAGVVVIGRGVRVFITPQTKLSFEPPLKVLQVGQTVRFDGTADPSGMNIQAASIRVSMTPIATATSRAP